MSDRVFNTKTVLAQGMFFESLLKLCHTAHAGYPGGTAPRGIVAVQEPRLRSNSKTSGLHAPMYTSQTETPNVNAEEGFMGLQADPNFAKNHFIYAFYSPKDTSVNRLSRFKFENDTLDMKSEQIILQFYSQRNICCHTGGFIAFGRDGDELFLSTGDNHLLLSTSPSSLL